MITSKRTNYSWIEIKIESGSTIIEEIIHAEDAEAVIDDLQSIIEDLDMLIEEYQGKGN